MIEFLDTSFTDAPLTINVMLGIVALASAVLGWFAANKRRHPVVWFVAALGGYLVVATGVRAIIPDLGEEQTPGKWQVLWSDPAFRADFVLFIVAIVGAVLIVFAMNRLSRQNGRFSRILGVAALVIPILIWAVTAVYLMGGNTNRIAAVSAFMIVVAVSGGFAHYLEDMPRALSLLGLAVLLLMLQAYHNSTIEKPESLLARSISIPIFMPLIPFALGWMISNRLKMYTQANALIWSLARLAWGMAIFAFAVSFFGDYEFGGSFVGDLAGVLEAPFQVAARLFGHVYYLIVSPNEGQSAGDLEFVLVTASGLAAWLLIEWRLWQLPALDARYTWGDYTRQIGAWRRLSLNQQRYLMAAVLIAPAILLRAFTTLYPFAETFALSFQKYNPAFPPRSYTDLANFEKLSTDLVVRSTLEFTLVFVFASTFFQVAIGLAVAHLLNAEFRLRGFSRMISLIPWAIPMVVVGIAARWLFDDDFGMIPDMVRRIFGYENNWLIDPVVAKYAVISVSVWKSTPFVALVLLAGLQGIPQDLFEAATVDGANRLQQLRFITIPMLLPILVTISMFMLVWQLATFDLPLTMTGGGPGFSTTVLAQKIYLEINSLNYSYAAALGIVLVGLVTIIGGVGLSLFRKVEVSQ